jgi:ribokinase
MLDLVCLGNVTIDDIVLADGTARRGCLGGDAIYAGLAAHMWSDTVGLVAPVGGDFPAEHVSRLEATGLDCRGMAVRTVPTRHNTVTYGNDGSRRWVVQTDPVDFHKLSPVTGDIPPSFLEMRGAVILAMDLAAQEELVAGLKPRGVVIALDPKEDYVDGNERRILRMLESVDVFLPSEIELERLLGHRDFRRAARQLSEYGCRIVVTKLGAAGVLAYEAASDRFIAAPAAPAQVVDTTGAGDCFSGGFMAAYARARDLEEAVAAGLVSASFAVEGFGATHLFDATREQALIRLRRLADSSRQSAQEVA